MNITQHSDNELSLVVMNDEWLYNIRFTLSSELLSELGIIHTSEQWDVLKQDILDEIGE